MLGFIDLEVEKTAISTQHFRNDWLTVTESPCALILDSSFNDAFCSIRERSDIILPFELIHCIFEQIAFIFFSIPYSHRECVSVREGGC